MTYFTKFLIGSTLLKWTRTNCCCWCYSSSWSRCALWHSSKYSTSGFRYYTAVAWVSGTNHFHENSWFLTNNFIISIGVYRVDRDIVFTNLIRPVPLNRWRVITDTPAVLAGHGAFTQHPPWEIHPHLQYLHSTTMSNAECITRSILARFIDPSYRVSIHFGHICAFAR